MKEKSNKSAKKTDKKYDEPVKIKGDFLDVFQVVKKNKEQKKKTK